MKRMLKSTAAAAVFAMTAGTASAATLTYDFTWTGSIASGFSMVGHFTAKDQNMDNVIRDGEVSSLTFEAFLNGTSLGVTTNPRSTADGPTRNFNFNFDMLTETFLNGNSFSGDGQLWNFEGTGVGFFDGDASAGFTIDGVGQGNNTNDPQNYTATLRQIATVPLPAGLPLLLTGLGLFGLLRRRAS